MRLLKTLPLLVASLALLVGCPKPQAASPGPGPKSPPANNGGQGGDNGGGDNGGGDNGGGDNGGGPAGDAPDWKVIPEDIHETIYPTLLPIANWPDPTGLKALESIEKDAKERPTPSRVRQLKQLVASLVAKNLQPSDPDAALGIDAKGRLYMRLGRTKTLGSASMEVAGEKSPFPVFALTLEGKGEGVKTIESLRSRVKKVLASDLGEELGQKDYRLEAHPMVKGGERIAGLALMNRNGYGMQFPYLYAFAGDEHLMVVFQEVPHMKAPDGD